MTHSGDDPPSRQPWPPLQCITFSIGYSSSWASSGSIVHRSLSLKVSKLAKLLKWIEVSHRAPPRWAAHLALSSSRPCLWWTSAPSSWPRRRSSCPSAREVAWARTILESALYRQGKQTKHRNLQEKKLVRDWQMRMRWWGVVVLLT